MGPRVQRISMSCYYVRIQACNAFLSSQCRKANYKYNRPLKLDVIINTNVEKDTFLLPDFLAFSNGKLQNDVLQGI